MVHELHFDSQTKAAFQGCQGTIGYFGYFECVEYIKMDLDHFFRITPTFPI